jgi:hypothetical protein
MVATDYRPLAVVVICNDFPCNMPVGCLPFETKKKTVVRHEKVQILNTPLLTPPANFFKTMIACLYINQWPSRSRAFLFRLHPRHELSLYLTPPPFSEHDSSPFTKRPRLRKEAIGCSY